MSFSPLININIINTLIIEKKDIVNINTEDNPKYTIQIMDEYVELLLGRSVGIWYKEQLIDMLPDDYNIVNETNKDNHGNSFITNKYIQMQTYYLYNKQSNNIY